jgi:hypothetical protein
MNLKSRPVTTILPLIVLALLQVGCAARQIRDAQDAFSDGARIENAERASVLFGRAPPVDSPSNGTSATVSYRTALHLLDAELKDHKQDLKEEKLLGLAMMLKAMTLWRLADLEATGDNASKGTDKKSAPARSEMTLAIDAAKREASNQLGTRDLVMADALPGLYDHDRGLRAVSLDEAQRFFSSAYWVLDDAITKPRNPPVAKIHPVMTYLRLAQLATLRSWESGIVSANPKLPDGSGSPDDKTINSIVSCFKLIAEELEANRNPGIKDLVVAFGIALGATTNTPPSVSQCQVPRIMP